MSDGRGGREARKKRHPGEARTRWRPRSRLVPGVLVTAVAVLFALLGPGGGTAQAAGGACHGHKVRTVGFSTGKVVIYRKGGYVCAMTFAKRPGPRRAMSVSIRALGSRAARDKGRFTHHAGPVTVHAGHRPVWVRGSVGGGKVSKGWLRC